MMPRIKISPGALLLFALTLFFDGSGTFSALIPAAAAHEAGHIAAVTACGGSVRCVRLDLFGISMDYTPRLDGRGSIICAAAGPLAGLIYALAAFFAGGDFLITSAALSLVLTFFNLLPALPLDGGRIVSSLCTAGKVRQISLVCALCVMSTGLALLVFFGTASLLIIGAWLLCCNVRG